MVFCWVLSGAWELRFVGYFLPREKWEIHGQARVALAFLVSGSEGKRSDGAAWEAWWVSALPGGWRNGTASSIAAASAWSGWGFGLSLMMEFPQQ